jgi:tetratricopeptide (TPR) repeat protein
VKFQKIEKFEEELQRKKFKKDFLLRSTTGTGKTSMLTYLSSKATEGGYSVFWIEPTHDVPSAQALMSRISSLEPLDSRIILVFDDIQKNPSIVELLSELKNLYPKVTVWVSLKKEASEEIKKRWIAVEREIAAEDLPGVLDRGDIKQILDEKFKELLDEKSRNWILRQAKEPIAVSYFSSLYANLIENQLVPPAWKEPETLIIRKTSFDPLENNKNLIIKQGKFEKFVLEVVSYLDGAPISLLQQMLHSYGAKDSSLVLDNILHRQLAYKEFCYRFVPETELVEFLKVDSNLQDLIRGEVAAWDRENTFPEILLDIGERDGEEGKEALLALYNEYENLPQEEKEKYVKLLLKKKQNPIALWIASDLSEFDDELLSLAEDALKENEKELPSQLFFNFGFSYTRRNQFEKAISYYKKAIYTGLKSSTDWDKYGQCFLEIGNYREAITCFKEAIKLDPNNSIAWVDLGIAQIALGDNKEAIKCFEKAVDIDPRNSEAWNKLGACYAQLNEHREAISCFKKAVGVNPKDFVAWHRMEVSYETLSKT